MADITCPISSSQRVVSATVLSGGSVSLQVQQVASQVSMTIQQGIKGPQGDPGPAGPPGPAGAAMEFANSNGVTFGVNASTVTASVKTDYLTAAAQTDHDHGALALTNIMGTSASSGFSLSAPAQSVQTQSRFNLSLAGATAGLLALVSSGVLMMAGGPNVTLSQDGNSISISAPNTHAQQTGISGFSAGANQISAGTVVFSNSNGMSFGLNGSTVTGSYTIPAQTVDTRKAGTGFTSAGAGLGLSGTLNTNGLSLSASAPSQSVQTQGSVQILGSSGAVSFGNANGITFGGNASTITASHNGLTTAAQSNHSHGNPSLALTNISGTTASASNGLTISLSAAAPGGGAAINVSAGTTSGNLQTLVLSNSNGMSFGLNGSTVTAAHNGLTTAAQSGHSHGVTLNLTNISGTTGGNSAGVTISLSASAPPAQTVQPVAASAANGSFNFSTLTFANSNGLSFSTGTQGVYGTVATNYAATNVTTANIATSQSSLFQHTSATSAITSAAMNTSERANYFATAGNTFANSTHSHGNPTLALTNINGTTASASNGMTMSLSAVVPAQSVQTQGMVSVNGSTGAMSLAAASSLSLSQNASTISFGLASNITTALQSAGAYLTTAAQSNHSHGNPTLNLTNLSGTTASNSNGLTISLSANVGGGGGAAISAGTQSVNTGTLVFANSNGLTFGMSGSSQITASHNGLTTAALSNHSHGNPTLNLTNISGTTASNSAGFTLSLSAGAGGGGGVALANSNTTYTSGTVQLTEGGGAITIASSAGQKFAFSVPATSSLSGINITITPNGSTLTISAAAPGGGGGGVAMSAGTQSVSTGTMVFSNSNGITFGMSGSSRMTASHNGLTTAMASNAGTGFMSTSERANYFATNAYTFANSTHSHGNPSLQLTNISGTTASNSAGLTISLSAAAPGGGAAIMISAGTTSGNVQTLVFSNANGVSFGLNGSTVTASAAAGGGGALNRNMIEIIQGERMTTIANLSASQFSRRPIFVPFWMDGQNLCPKTVRLMVSGVGSSNRSLVATFGVALYSKANDTQLTLFTSDSQAINITASSQSSVWNGVKIMDFTRMSDVTMTQEGRWVLATSLSASSHNATYCNMLLYGADNMPAFAGFIVNGTTSAANATSNVFPFWGVYSTTTNGFPGTVAMTQIQGGSSASLLDPYCIIKEV